MLVGYGLALKNNCIIAGTCLAVAGLSVLSMAISTKDAHVCTCSNKFYNIHVYFISYSVNLEISSVHWTGKANYDYIVQVTLSTLG